MHRKNQEMLVADELSPWDVEIDPNDPDSHTTNKKKVRSSQKYVHSHTQESRSRLKSSTKTQNRVSIKLQSRIPTEVVTIDIDSKLQ